MKRTLAILSLLIITQFFTFTLNAQEQIQEQKTFKNTYTLNASRLLFNEARFGFERQFSELEAFRVILGIKYSFGAESFESFKIGFGTFPYHFKVSKGVYLGVGYNYTINEKKGVYFSTEWYYTFNYYNDKYYQRRSGEGADEYVSLESMRLQKYGLKFLFGKKTSKISNDKMALELDFFAGAGLQFRVNKITINERYSGGHTNDYSKLTKIDPPEIDTDKKFYPTIHIGLLIGVSFKGN